MMRENIADIANDLDPIIEEFPKKKKMISELF